MFLRKLFKIGDKLRWLFLELVVVFIGVYLAFLFQNYSANRRESAESQKVFSALKSELEFFRVKMPGRSSYTFGVLRDYQKSRGNESYVDFSGWRFLEPQYGYQIVEYAINLENTNIIDFPLYQALQKLHSSIKRLEHAERMMMEVSQSYRLVPKTLPASSAEVIARHTDNFMNFQRLIMFTRDRASDQRAVALDSEVCLELINARMDQEIRAVLERDLIFNQIDEFSSLDDALKAIKKYFPNFTDEEVTAIFREHEATKGK